MRNVKDHVSSVEINHLMLDVLSLISEGSDEEVLALLECIKSMASLYDVNGEYDEYSRHQKKLYEHMVMMKLGMDH